ncbi:DUF5133 domain-containing protein [Streptomyces sp. NPDC001500]
MLMPHPAVLRTLVDEYEALSATGTAEARAQERDLAYTLCVSTGTREVDEALRTARRWLEAASAADTTATRPQATVVRPQTTVPGPQATVAGPQATVPGPQATVPSPQATVAGPQATVARPHTGEVRSQSDDGPRVYA